MTSPGSLPPGLTLGTTTGAISGTPSAANQYNFAVEVTDASGQSATRALSMSVSAAMDSSLNITTASLSAGQVSQPYNVALSATGGTPPYTWGSSTSSGSLPPGLTLGTTTGAISGTPSVASQYSFTVRVTDSSSPQQTATKTLSIATLGVSLDPYGGREDINCASVTPYFHLEKINNRWWFCDPAGNAFVSMNVGNVVPNGNPTFDCQGRNTYPIYLAKYGDTTYNWGWQTLKRMTGWGFNSIGQDSDGNVMPFQQCSNCMWPGGSQPIPLPYISEPKPAEYASVNLEGYLPEPIKDEVGGTNGNYVSWRGGALFDVFDPKLNTEWKDELAASTAERLKSNYPYLLGIFTDDSDYFTGAGNGPDFVAHDTGANLGYITLTTSPVQTLIQSTPFQGESFLYKQTEVYSKAQATNPTTPCSIQEPCSLRDYLWQKYNGNISNLNSAWGSNYTTFDSTGTSVTQNIGTGNGSTQTFTATLGHAPISPLSVLISVGGTPEIGDCPWFHLKCTATTNEGQLLSPTSTYVTESTIDYATGTITLTFVKAPANGAAITVNYIYNGWMSGGSGLMDESGSGSWVGTNNFCLEGPDPNYPTYFSCTGAGGDHKPKPNADPNLGADIDNWIPQFSAKYFKTMHDDLRAVSQIPYLGLDTFGGYAYSKFLEGAAPYLDGAFVGLFSWPEPQLQPGLFEAGYQYLTQYLGDKPLLNFTVDTAQPDSSYSCYATPSNDQGTQAKRGQVWSNTVNYLLTTPGANGDYPFVGFDWWSWQDFQNLNQGLVSIHDNAYDAYEDQVSSVPCSPPEQNLFCGGEAGNYGDAIAPIQQATGAWLSPNLPQ